MLKESIVIGILIALIVQMILLLLIVHKFETEINNLKRLQGYGDVFAPDHPLNEIIVDRYYIDPKTEVIHSHKIGE